MGKSLHDMPSGGFVKSELNVNFVYEKLSGAINHSKDYNNPFRNQFEIDVVHMLCEKIIELEDKIKKLEEK